MNTFTSSAQAMTHFLQKYGFSPEQRAEVLKDLGIICTLFTVETVTDRTR